MMPDYQLKIPDLLNIQYNICNVKKLAPNHFDKEFFCASLQKLETLFKARINAKTVHHVIKFNH